MFLKALRVKGFKSFPLQTELVFEPGVSVIIGPNGSGKSNIADAVVWALGEQSPSTVRGSSMQDVIFAGSDGRRAAGAAEVELTFDNRDRALQMPVDEVSVRRRVTRDGTSQYAINQSTCRLDRRGGAHGAGGSGPRAALHHRAGQGRVVSRGQARGPPQPDRGGGRPGHVQAAPRARRSSSSARCGATSIAPTCSSARSTPSSRRCGARPPPPSSCARSQADLDETRGRLLSGDIAAVDARAGAAARGGAPRRRGAGALRRGARGCRPRARRRGGGVRAASGRARAPGQAPAARPGARRTPGERATPHRAAAAPPRGGRPGLRPGARAAHGRAGRGARGGHRGRRGRRRSAVWPRPSTAAEASHAEVAGRLTAAREQLGARPRGAEPPHPGARERAHGGGPAGAPPGGAGRRGAAPHSAARGARRGGRGEGRRRACAPRWPRWRRGRRWPRPPRPLRRRRRPRRRSRRRAWPPRSGTALSASNAAPWRPRSITWRPRCATCRTWAPTCSRSPAHIPARSRWPRPSRASRATSVPSRPRSPRSRVRSRCRAAWTTGRCSGRSRDAGIGLVRLVVRPPRPRPPVGVPRGGAAHGQGRAWASTASWRPRWPTWSSSTTCAPSPTSSPASRSRATASTTARASGQIGLASGVPAALLLERRAAMERLRDRLDAVRAREMREEAAAAVAARDAAAAREVADARAAEEREARIVAETRRARAQAASAVACATWRR